MARDQRLHAHVRGLLALLQGNDQDAISWFRRSIDSPTFGFTRNNWELAGIFLRIGRPAEKCRSTGARRMTSSGLGGIRRMRR